MGRHRILPIVVMRWFRKGQDLAFHPDAAAHCRDASRALSEVKNRFEVSVVNAFIDSNTRLIGEVRPDPMCPDERGRNRAPFIAVLSVVKGGLTSPEHDILMQEIRQLDVPDEPGSCPELYVTIEDRWTIHRLPCAVARGSFVQKWLGGGEPEALSSFSDEEVKRRCNAAEMELLDASKRNLSTFSNACAPDCLLWTSEKCVQTNEAQIGLVDLRHHVFHVDDLSWEINVRFLGSSLVLLASRCRDGLREQITHQFELLSTPHKLRLMRSDYSLIPDLASRNRSNS